MNVLIAADDAMTRLFLQPGAAALPLLAVHGRLCKPFKNDDLYDLLARWLHRA